MAETYRTHFSDTAKAAAYDSSQYSSGSHGEMIWQIEKVQLSEFLKRFRQSHQRIDYLDFAAGTGRVISFMEDKVDQATGIEISDKMIEIAQTRVSRARLIQADITSDDAPIEGKYDLITAFRFVLNAEPSLRLAGMKALAARLKNDSSRLVFTNQGNLWSVKLFMWPFHVLRRLGRGYQAEGNYMTLGQARRLARQAGLEIEEVRGSGFLSPKALRLFSPVRVQYLEQRLSRSSLLAKFATNQMYVARKT